MITISILRCRIFRRKIITTIPRTGFSARLAIPVLKDREVISRMAVPVVSEPVPAVVGIAIRGYKVLVIGRPFPTGALMKSMRSESLYAENLEKKSVKCRYVSKREAYRFAALAVSMTLPPPTLKVHGFKRR